MLCFFLRKALLISPIPATSRGCGGSFSDTFQRHFLYTLVLLKSAYEISWVLFVNKACDKCQIIVRCKAKTTRSQPPIGNIGRMIWPLATVLSTTPDPAHTQRKNMEKHSPKVIFKKNESCVLFVMQDNVQGTPLLLQLLENLRDSRKLGRNDHDISSPGGHGGMIYLCFSWEWEPSRIYKIDR